VTEAIEQSGHEEINGVVNEIIVMKSTLQRTGSVYNIIDKVLLTI
jgi:2'-5' RNA ligase